MEIGLALLGASLALALATALADAEGVTLAWDASADHAHVSHYQVHYGVSSRAYLLSTNAMEFFRNGGLRIEPVRVVTSDE